MRPTTNRRRQWAFFGIALAVGAGALGIGWRYAAVNGAPPAEAEPLAVAVTESVTVAETRGAGSDDSAEESSLAGPRGLGTMTGRVPGTTAIVSGVRLASHKVNVVIHDGLARTEVEETFENTTARVLEGRYLFPVPPDASVSRLALYVGTELVEGEIVERERAARIFKGIVEDTVRPRDPALLEWVKGSEVSLKVFPLPAHGTRKIVLAYDQVLSQASSQVRYLYPLSLGQDRAVSIDELSIDVTAADATTSLVAVRTPGYAATTSPSGPLHVGYSAHAFTPASDFILEYERAPSAGPDVSAYPAPASAGEIGKKVVAEDGYLAMRLPIQAPAVTQARTAHERAIVLDISQSQSKETLAGEIAVARGLLRRLDGGQRFTVLACDSACGTFPDDGLATASPTTIEDVGRWLSALSVGGSSDIAGSLLAATKRLAGSPAGQIVYLGDGAASAGELTAETIVARVRPEIVAHTLDVRLFGAGRTVDEIVLGGLARSLGASYERVSTGEPLSRRIDAIALGLDNPLLVDAALEVPDGVYDVHPKVLPNLHAGQELLITARARAGERGEIKIKGTLGGAPYQDTKAIVWNTATAPVPPRLWATAKIADLEASNDEAARKEVVALSRAHRVMSRAASFLVLENDQMFSEFGIERKGKKSAEPDVAGLLKALEGPSGGMVGLLDGRAGGTSSIISSADSAPSPDSLGTGGLGLSGKGEGGGGRGEGIGLGSTGTLGHGAGTGEGFGSFGSGHGRLGGEHMVKPPSVRMGAVSVSGRLPPEVIQRIVRQNFGRFRLCYENGLRSNPDLQGRVSVRFVIGLDGNVSSVSNGGSDLPDGGVVACVVRSFGGLMFPAPDGGSVTVTYPIVFAPEGGSVARFPVSHFGAPPPSAVHVEGTEQWTTQGEADLAKLRGALRDGETSRQRHDGLIRGLLAHGRFAEALTAAKRFAEIDPDLASARELLAQTAAAAGDGALARTSLDAELETAPTSVDLHLRAARAFEAAGDERRACAHFRSLVELRKTDDDARYEALRCRARLDERDTVVAEINAIEKPGKRVAELAKALASGAAPAYVPAATSGDFEAKLACSGESEHCPTVVVVTPSGKVISPWTPAARGGAVTMSGLSSGTYRTLLVGGDPGTACDVAVRTFGATRKFSVAHGGTQTVAATLVTIPEASFGGAFGWR